ncbi:MULTISPECIES: type III secretion effector protein [unclassified Pseudomonas]|uniref:SpaN/EivJ family type III secretion system needle length determinant n=1 Tax=unclassified Pseudomonas TaxID=196821 RepID=UPI000CD26EA2|nr:MULTISPECIES: type III secretion effector protein [unclassified Pseudomonas]POA14975.1 type III secretion effector protein [Pseudomonas sp. MPBD7-1]
MNEVFAVPTGPVQALEPVDEGPLDELLDQLVPVQEDELPQGVLDLVTALILPRRPLMEAALTLTRQAMKVAQEALAVERDEARPFGRDTEGVEPAGKRWVVRQTLAFPQAGPPFGKLTQYALPQRLEPVVSGVDKAAVSASVESLAVEPFTAPRLDEQPLPQAPMSAQGPRQTPAVAPATLPSAALPPAPPMLEVMVEALPDTGRGVLQVPFNRGAASGQITITRVPEESPRSLTLNPSNTLVFEQLKAPFELAREPAWRLADSGGEQSRQGSHQAPDEEQDEQVERPA